MPKFKDLIPKTVNESRFGSDTIIRSGSQQAASSREIIVSVSQENWRKIPLEWRIS